MCGAAGGGTYRDPSKSKSMSTVEKTGTQSTAARAAFGTKMPQARSAQPAAKPTSRFGNLSPTPTATPAVLPAAPPPEEMAAPQPAYVPGPYGPRITVTTAEPGAATEQSDGPKAKGLRRRSMVTGPNAALLIPGAS